MPDADFGEPRLVEVHLPNNLRPQDRCSVASLAVFIRAAGSLAPSVRVVPSQHSGT